MERVAKALIWYGVLLPRNESVYRAVNDALGDDAHRWPGARVEDVLARLCLHHGGIELLTPHDRSGVPQYALAVVGCYVKAYAWKLARLLDDLEDPSAEAVDHFNKLIARFGETVPPPEAAPAWRIYIHE